LRIAVVSPFVDRRHGTERALVELLERLGREKHCEIHLYAQRVENLPVAESSPRGPAISGRIIWHKVPSIAGPHLLQFISWLFLNTLCRAWDHLVHGLRFEVLLSPGINCLDADVVIVHALFHRLQELSREERLDSPRPGFFRRLHRRAYYAVLCSLERRIYSNPRVALAAVSRRTADLLGHYFQRQDVHVIPNGIDTAQFSPSLRRAGRHKARQDRHFEETDFVLLFIGNDWGLKGLPVVLRAMRALRDLPFHIIVVGTDAPENFRECAGKLGILEKCRFEPPRQDVGNLYAAADLYVSPSLEDAFGLPVAEAMACGLPAITSPFAGVSELFQDGVEGFVLSDPRDAQELTRLMQRCFEDEELRISIGRAAASLAIHWTWERHASAIRELLEHSVEGK
jgi:UDP-glucose:(heptosyl)LPS alpha-1,3-glucosyltransferase